MFKKIVMVFGVMMAVASPFALAAVNSEPVSAAVKDKIQEGVNNAGGTGEEKLEVRVKNIVNTILFIVGILAVIVIIVSGIFYIISAGDAGKVKRAKDTLMYAVVGLVVAILAYAIVNFVLGVF